MVVSSKSTKLLSSTLFAFVGEASRMMYCIFDSNKDAATKFHAFGYPLLCYPRDENKCEVHITKETLIKHIF